MHRILNILLATMAAGAIVPAQAQQHDHHGAMPDARDSACVDSPMALPAEMAGWTAPTPMAAARDTASLAKARLTLGAAVDAALHPTPDVSYALRPQRPAGSVSHGGMVAFTVEREGIYRVGLNSAVWIDVVADGKTLDSVNHGNALACAGIRKIVDFRLTPGDYVIQFVGSGTPDVRVMVAALPET